MAVILNTVLEWEPSKPVNIPTFGLAQSSCFPYSKSLHFDVNFHSSENDHLRISDQSTAKFFPVINYMFRNHSELNVFPPGRLSTSKNVAVQFHWEVQKSTLPRGKNLCNSCKVRILPVSQMLPTQWSQILHWNWHILFLSFGNEQSGRRKRVCKFFHQSCVEWSIKHFTPHAKY